MRLLATSIYFSDTFGVSPAVLEDYGAFDISLVNDLPLFIDPFLLFNSSNPQYRALHEEIVKYVSFLRDKALSGQLTDGLAREWCMFPEVKQTWLGYSLVGNAGRGLGESFAFSLRSNLATVFSNFGREPFSRSAHLEKLCLFDENVGRDNISDFVTNLVKAYLLDYTQEFARLHLAPSLRKTVRVPRVRFNYLTESWESARYDLPSFDGDFVLLTPIDLLTKDEAWINRTDFFRDHAEVIRSIENEALREQLSGYLTKRLDAITQRDREARDRTRRESSRRETKANRRRRVQRGTDPTNSQRAEALMDTLRQYPNLIDLFIRWKEDHGEDAVALAESRVRESQLLYLEHVRSLVTSLYSETGFYGIAGGTRAEAAQRIKYLKDVIENKGGHRIFFANGEPIRRESDLHIMFRFTWCNTPSDVNREVNNGRGPSDFEISRGRFDKSLVEFKLASNSGLERNLARQAEVYKKASDAQHALKVIVYFSADELAKVTRILRSLGLVDHPDVVLIDARSDNKPSGSKA